MAEIRPPLTGESRIARRPDLLTATVDGEVMMMSIAQGRYFGLDDIGTDIWKRLERDYLLSELVDGLAEDYEGPRDRIENDVIALLQRMAAHDLVTFS